MLMMTSSNVIPTICVLQHPNFITGWGFGTWLLFFHKMGMSSQLTFIFFRGLGSNHQPEMDHPGGTSDDA
jgi:hypothetical protein